MLGTPAPRVITWNSNAVDEVQAEYIIMEKAEGVQRSSVWPTMETSQMAQVVRAVANYLRAWTEVSFEQIGSLYYTHDLPVQSNLIPAVTNIDPNGQEADSKFVVGPITGRDWMDDGRAALHCGRGPCELPLTIPYGLRLTAITRRVNGSVQASRDRKGPASCARSSTTATTTFNALWSWPISA